MSASNGWQNGYRSLSAIHHTWFVSFSQRTKCSSRREYFAVRRFGSSDAHGRWITCSPGAPNSRVAFSSGHPDGGGSDCEVNRSLGSLRECTREVLAFVGSREAQPVVAHDVTDPLVAPSDLNKNPRGNSLTPATY